MCLPLRSILPLRPGFFPERGCSHSPEVHRTAGTLRAFGAGSEQWQVSVSQVGSPQPPVPRRERAGRAAGRWGVHTEKQVLQW
jgi:hypothetical protein